MNLEAWLALLEQRHPQAVELGLERCGTVYQRLGSPRPAKKVFTVAGTNGKGSTVAYLAAMSAALGQRFGTYTSPHIFRFNERISIMGEPVTDDALVRAFERVEAQRGEISLTYFEFTTLAGLLILQQSKLDCAILEVGLGGRLDTVNLVDTDCAVITPIGLDHQDFLGSDLSSIAAEKAGIIRQGAPVVCTQNLPAAPVLETARNLQAPVFRRGIDFDLVSCPAPDDGLLQFTMGGQSMPVPMPAMKGQHQLDNLAAALAGLFLLNPACIEKAEEIGAAIRDCRVAGRLQKVFSSPDILLDVGHNALAAEVVATFLEENKISNVTCVLAMLADKPTEAVAEALGAVCQRWLCAATPGDRGQHGEVLARRIKTTLPAADVSHFEALGEALQAAISMTGKDETILVFGSFLTVSGAANWLNKCMQRDAHDTARIN